MPPPPAAAASESEPEASRAGDTDTRPEAGPRAGASGHPSCFQEAAEATNT